MLGFVFGIVAGFAAGYMYGSERAQQEARRRLSAFAAELAELRVLVGSPVVDVIAEVVDRTGLGAEIEAAPVQVAQARRANLAAFVDAAARFPGVDGSTDLPAFLGFLDAAADAERTLGVLKSRFNYCDFCARDAVLALVRKRYA
jgi:DNA helicase-2/ATP-dependent DNA helicase PcrA